MLNHLLCQGRLGIVNNKVDTTKVIRGFYYVVYLDGLVCQANRVGSCLLVRLCVFTKRT